MVRTHSKTKSVTNLQLMVAVLAAFVSGGLAFAGAKVNTPRPLVINQEQDCNDAREADKDIDYLIVTTKQFCEAAKKLQTFRNARGHKVAIVTIDTTPLISKYTPESLDRDIENYSKQKKKLQYIVLLGSIDTVPTFHFTSNFYSDDINYTSDYDYSVVGNRNGVFLPTFMVGRIPIHANEEIDPYLRKVNVFENKRSLRSDVLFFGFSPEIDYYGIDHSEAVSEQGFRTLTQVNPHDDNAFYDFLNTERNISYITYYSHGSWYGNGPVNVDNFDLWTNSGDPVVYLSGGCGFSEEGSPQRSFSEIMLFRDNGAVAAIGATKNGGYGADYEFPPIFFEKLKTSKTLGQVFKNSIIGYNNEAVAQGRNVVDINQFDSLFMHRLTLMGDPALRVGAN